jgi:stearoyl-CoA desaturase (delta-9 desaturase)
VENKIVSVLSGGEGWHNFHHIFPSDYRASEYGNKHDTSTEFIEIMQRIGWAYDLKKTPQHLVNQWIKKYGDGSHSLYLEEQDSTDKIWNQQSNKFLNSKHETLKGNTKIDK